MPLHKTNMAGQNIWVEALARSLIMPILAREHDRVAALRSLGVLDTIPDPYLDDLTRVAATELGMPIARLNLIDAEREWTKAAFGYPAGLSIPRDLAFCSQAILDPDQIMIVPDTKLDARFDSIPLVTGEPGVRFYAGAPVVDSAGRALGALSVMDTQPGSLRPEQASRLMELAALAAARLSSYEDWDTALLASEEHYRTAVNLNPQVPWTALPDGAVEDASPRWLELTGMSHLDARGNGWTKALHPDDLPGTLDVWHGALANGEPLDVEYRLLTRGAGYRWFRSRATARRGWDGSIVRWYGTVEDVHNRKLMDTALRESEQRFRSALEVGGLGAWEYDAVRGFVNATDLCAQAFGFERGMELTDYSVVEAALHPDDREVLARERSLVLSGDYQMDVDLRNVRKDGSVHWVRLTGRAVFGADGRAIKAYGLAQDTTGAKLAKEERESWERQLLHMANHDGLTDLANRRLFDAKLAESLKKPYATAKVALICVDLDEFKGVNASLSHGAGDRLLGEVARRLRDCVRESDTIGRTGGDEFALLARVEDVTEAKGLTNAILEVLKAPFTIDGGEIAIGCSIGVAVAPDDASFPEHLQRNAYAALGRAKASGRGVCRFFEAEMDVRYQARQELRKGFRAALDGEQMRLFYQPLVDLESGQVRACEALLRWQHPRRGLLSPDEFIPLAEESGWICRLGQWALVEACREAASWPEAIRIAVNLSVMQFTSGELVPQVATALLQAGLSAQRLELEVTESLLLHESENNLASLEHLRRLGIRLVMDDFGAGYSSLAYLRRFRFDSLKVDKSLITGLPDADGGDKIVAAIVALGHSLGIEVTAEGIENEAQLELLRRLGCAQGQGYFFSRPVPGAELSSLLKTGRFKVAQQLGLQNR